MKRLVALTLLTMFSFGAPAQPSFAQGSPLLTSPSSGWETTTSPATDNSPKEESAKPSAEDASKKNASADADRKKIDKQKKDEEKKAAKEKAKADKEKAKAEKAKADADAKASAATDTKPEGEDRGEKKEAIVDPPIDKKKEAEADTKSGAPAKTAKTKSSVPLPTRLASFTCGAVLGYPVAMAKRTVHQTKQGTRDFVGEGKNPIVLLPAMVVSFPYGVVGGFLEGWQYTVMNSWKASGEDPFSKETFSLDD